MPAGPAGCQGGGGTQGTLGFGLAYGFVDTDLVFGDDDFALTQHAVVVTGSYQVDSAWTLRLSLGSVVAGELVDPGRTFRFEPGFVIGLGATIQTLPANDANLLLNVSMSLAATFAETTSTSPGMAAASNTSYTAFDARVGLVFGATLYERWTPYLVARAFGGPVMWAYDDGDGQTGTDATHVQLGAGSALILTDAVSLFVEGIFFGERGVAAGLEIRP